MFVHFLAVLTSASLVYSQSSDYDYIGGVALRYPDGCPTGTFAGAITYQQNCCPDGQFFPTDADYCCGNATDCGSLVDAHVKCADPSWEYCPSPADAAIGFCCLAGWVCYEELANGNYGGGGVACGPPGYQLEAYQTAVPTVFPANEGPGATPSSSTSVITSTTSTVSTSISVTITGATSTSTSTPTTVSASTVTGTSTTSASSTTSIALGVGLGVGIPIVLLLAGLFGFFIWRSRRNNRMDSASEPFRPGYGTEAKQGPFGDQANYPGDPGMEGGYMMNNLKTELPADAPRGELGGGERSEMWG